jgi:hypothetical protein
LAKICFRRNAASPFTQIDFLSQSETGGEHKQCSQFCFAAISHKPFYFLFFYSRPLRKPDHLIAQMPDIAHQCAQSCITTNSSFRDPATTRTAKVSGHWPGMPGILSILHSQPSADEPDSSCTFFSVNNLGAGSKNTATETHRNSLSPVRSVARGVTSPWPAGPNEPGQNPHVSLPVMNLRVEPRLIGVEVPTAPVLRHSGGGGGESRLARRRSLSPTLGGFVAAAEGLGGGGGRPRPGAASPSLRRL